MSTVVRRAVPHDFYELARESLSKASLAVFMIAHIDELETPDIAGEAWVALVGYLVDAERWRLLARTARHVDSEIARMERLR